MRKQLPLVVACFLLAACAQAPVRQGPTAEQKAAVDTAMRRELECAVRNVAKTDDGVSDAATVAFALALRCGAEYNAVTEAQGATLDNDRQREMFRDRRAPRERRIEDFLDVVMHYRQTVKSAGK